MRAVTVALDGRDLCLVFNGMAMFEINDRFGGVRELNDAMQQTGSGRVEALGAALATLSKQGAAVQRHMGYDVAEPVAEDVISALILPKDVTGLVHAVNTAIAIGFGREVAEQSDVDIGLMELRQKKTKS